MYNPPMVQENEQYIAERSEYHLRVPKVPRQSVEVFGRDVKNGNYGLSAEKIDTVASYFVLQQTLNTFEDLTFSSDFIDRLPNEVREKLGENLHPGLALVDLEIPTTDKVLLAQMLAADRLSETLSQAPLEIWVTPEIQKELEEFGLTCETGLQKLDYTQLDLEGKMYLVETMEQQEHKVHAILAARNRFPNGVPPLGLRAILSGQTERTVFDTLKDLEAQYKVAQDVLENPLLVWFSEVLDKGIKAQEDEKSKKPRAKRQEKLEDILDEFPIRVEEEAEGDWWSPSPFTVDYKRWEKVMKKVEAFLRPRYADRSIYEILGADNDQDRDEVLAAFWRTGKSRRIDFGNESFLIDELYLKPDGNLECHFRDDNGLDDSSITQATGSLTSYDEVAMVDQAVKWIRKEISSMKAMREQWERSGFVPNPTLEVTLAQALGVDRDSELQSEIDALPKWFLEALNQDVRYYDGLITYTPSYSINDLFALLDTKDKPRQNMIKSYFDLSNVRLERDRRLIINPTELYKDLDLESEATSEEVKRAYRRIAQETKAIHIKAESDFDAEEWRSMNNRFIRATRAYSALSRRRLGETRVTTLGKLTSYFNAAE